MNAAMLMSIAAQVINIKNNFNLDIVDIGSITMKKYISGVDRIMTKLCTQFWKFCTLYMGTSVGSVAISDAGN